MTTEWEYLAITHDQAQTLYADTTVYLGNPKLGWYIPSAVFDPSIPGDRIGIRDEWYYIRVKKEEEET